jgi:hypothetical protein
MCWASVRFNNLGEMGVVSSLRLTIRTMLAEPKNGVLSLGRDAARQGCSTAVVSVIR